MVAFSFTSRSNTRFMSTLLLVVALSAAGSPAQSQPITTDPLVLAVEHARAVASSAEERVTVAIAPERAAEFGAVLERRIGAVIVDAETPLYACDGRSCSLLVEGFAVLGVELLGAAENEATVRIRWAEPAPGGPMGIRRQDLQFVRVGGTWELARVISESRAHAVERTK
jgi:hypothetical protein